MEQQHMFTNRMIRNLLVPVVLEQILNSIMGTADTMMVSNVGSAALFCGIAGGFHQHTSDPGFFQHWQLEEQLSVRSISDRKIMKKPICQQDRYFFIITVISVAVSAVCLIFQKPLLRLIFGAVEADVMRASETYFFFTALSFPFIAAYDSAASIFRARRTPGGL